MKIKVTEDHIQAGEPLCADFCPIALAAKDAGLTGVRVYKHSIWFRKNKATLTWEYLPPKASEFVTDFDNNEAVEPFEFEIET